MKVLEIDDLKVRFGAVEAVRGLDLAVEGGEIFGLPGPNGAGKTSTLAAVEGLVTPAAGTVKNHVNSILAKLRVRHRSEAALKARGMGRPDGG